MLGLKDLKGYHFWLLARAALLSAAAGTNKAYKTGTGSRTWEQGPGALEYKATSVCGFHQH